MAWASLCAAGMRSRSSLTRHLSLRLDERSEAGFRSQYRFRFEPSCSLSGMVRALVSRSGDPTTLPHSIGENDDQMHVRRLFAIQATVLALSWAYKGRVSSTGLSQEGWIKGTRVVMGTDPAQLEVVVGELGSTGARNALNAFEKLNYVGSNTPGSIRIAFLSNWAQNGCSNRRSSEPRCE